MNYDFLNIKHPQYQWFFPFWNRCRHLYQGEDAIKNYAETYAYLPRPDGMKDWAYTEYVTRATLPGIFESTVNGRLGDIFRKSPIAQGNEDLLNWVDNQGVTTNDESIDILANRILRELMITGRCALVLDFDQEQNRFFIHLYKAEDIQNWETTGSFNKEILLKEVSFDRHHPKTTVRESYLCLKLIDGVYVAHKYEKGSDGEMIEVVREPSMAGQSMDFIPIVFINSDRLGMDCNDPPMLNLSNLLLSYFRNSADYEQGLHAIGVPTPYITGLRQTDATFTLGPFTPIVIEPPDAKIGFLEFAGSGMSHLKDAMDEKLIQAVMMGARLLQPRRQVESAEAAHTRMGAETSILNNLVRVTEEAIEGIMYYWLLWNGKDATQEEYSYLLNRDFIEESLDPNVLKAINESEIQGVISPQAAFNLRKKLEVYEDGTTFEQEQDNIKQLGSNIFEQTSNSPVTNGNME